MDISKHKIFVTGGHGMLGTALCKRLRALGMKIIAPTIKELNLLKYSDTLTFLKKHKPNFVFHLAAKVGGIQSNIEKPIEFLVNNTTMSNNIILASQKMQIKNLINMSSACIYPSTKETLSEEDFLTGKLEPNKEGYAIAKISAVLLCNFISQTKSFNYKSIAPCNLYGPNDNFSDDSAHFIPAIIKKIHLAKINQYPHVYIWGDGKSKREILFVEDLVDFLKMALINCKKLPNLINVGSGADFAIFDYYLTAAKIIGYKGKFLFDQTKPNGVRKRLLNSDKSLKFKWKPKTSLEEGIKKTYDFFLQKLTQGQHK